MLEKIARKGLPVVLDKATADVLHARAIVLPVTRAKAIVGLRIYSVGVVEKKEKLRVIHELTFSGSRVKE